MRSIILSRLGQAFRMKEAISFVLYNYATTTSPTSSGFMKICEDLDIPSYVDYFIAQTYYNNGDWLGEVE